MSCTRYEDGLIDLALGGEADPRLRAHLEACAACRGRLDEERSLASQVDGMLAHALDVEPRAGFEARVRRQVESRRAQPTARLSRPAFWVGLTAAAALAAVVMLTKRPPGAPVEVAVTTATPLATAAPTAPPQAAALSSATTTRPRLATAGVTRRREEPEVLVPPDQYLALRRYAERVRENGLPDAAPIAAGEPLAFAPPPFEARLEELPRLQTADQPLPRPAESVTSLIPGGEL
jgi:hypothetical protein